METILAGHYQIIRPLGRGGFGQTFLARDKHLPGHPFCVVKQLQPVAKTPEVLEVSKRLFDREATTLYRLGNHDQIPYLMAHFEQNREFYLVQEYIIGQSLDKELLPDKPMSEEAVIELLRDILNVLAFVHQQHVIHRDIKPANLIRRSKDNRIVLIDFGAVKEVRSQTLCTSSEGNMTVAIGSPGYMPKEQRLFYPRFCSDIYAVGIVCMQALSGLRPKQLSVDPATQELYCSRLGDRISISPGFAAILDKMVRCDYRQRYENATVALQALREFLGSSKSLSSPIRSFVPNPDSDETQPKTASAITPTIRPPQRLSKHHNLSCSEPSISSENLSNDFKKRLEQLLAEFLGPIASLILKSALSDASTFGELITHLSMVITAQRRSHFCQQAHLLSQDLGNNSISLVQNQSSIDSTSYPFLKVSPDFIKQCEVELTTLIGPIASVFVQRTVSLTPNLSSAELINALTRYVRDTKVAETFRRTLYTRL